MRDDKAVKGPIDIVMVSYERPDFTERSIRALKERTSTPYRLIVVDNGSLLQTTGRLMELRNNGFIDVLVLLDENLGLEPAKMIGLSHVRSSVYVDTDNDILCSQGWMTQLKTLFDRNPEYGAIACRTQVYIGARDEDIFPPGCSDVSPRDFVGGSLRMMDTELVRSCGGWRTDPSDMTEANRGEEKWICGKLREKGFKVGYARDIRCYHLFGNDGEWGYGHMPHYHRDIWPRPKDAHFTSEDQWLGT